jgi:hypothetical protein
MSVVCGFKFLSHVGGLDGVAVARFGSPLLRVAPVCSGILSDLAASRGPFPSP